MHVVSGAELTWVQMLNTAAGLCPQRLDEIGSSLPGLAI